MFRERKRRRQREKDQCVGAFRAPLLGTWPATEACALTGNPSVCRPVLSLLSHTSRGGFYSCRVDISWLVLVGFYHACAVSYVTLKLLHMTSPMIFLDCPPRGGAMLTYYTAVMMKQGSCSILCTDAVMICHNSALFQKAGATSLRTGSLLYGCPLS